MHPDCPTCAGLLAAVIANRSDDLPRLVMADHLEGEHGDKVSVARAGFIRCQIELAGIDSGPLHCEPHGTLTAYGRYTHHCRCQVCKLRRREYMVSRRFIVWDFCGGIDGGWAFMCSSSQSFARGFCETVRGTWADWRQHAPAILAATPLRSVQLTTLPDVNRTIDDGALARLWPDITFTLTDHWIDLTGRLNPERLQRLREAGR